jgi:ethanolamine permease
MGHSDDNVKIGLATIWAIGVGSALGGDFFGWQFVLYGGFGSAVGAVAFSAAFYWLYAGAITELAARYKTSGGSFDFVKAAIGRHSAALMAVLGLLKLILANSALALSISSYLVQGGMSKHLQVLCWIGTYGIFTVLDSVGVRQSANIQVMATALCVLILIFYAASSLTKFSFSYIKSGGLVHDGARGFFKGLPFSLQFFDGFEEVPLLMGYAIDPERTIPMAIIACYVTVSVIAALVLISGSGITPFNVVMNSDAPLMDGIELIYGTGTAISDFVAYLIVLGLVVNFFAFVLFASQQVQAVAEAGQLPEFLAYRHPVHGAPINASVCASIVGLALTAGFAFFFDEAQAQDILVTAALMPAVLGYALLLECIVRVRSVEALKDSDILVQRDIVRLGCDPGALRFQYGAYGARLAQMMCFVFAVGLLVLATVSKNFLYGLVILGFLGLATYAGMEAYAKGHIVLNEYSDDEKFYRSRSGDGDSCIDKTSKSSPREARLPRTGSGRNSSPTKNSTNNSNANPNGSPNPRYVSFGEEVDADEKDSSQQYSSYH